MRNLFSSVMFGGRDLLMDADKGTSGGGAPGAGEEEGATGEGEGEDEGTGEGEGTDEEEDEDTTDPLDLPQFSKRQVAGLISGRVNEVKKQYANHSELNEVASMIAEIIGAPDFNAVVTNLRGLQAQHRAKAGQPPVVQTYQAPNAVDTKRQATAAEFDNSFVKDPEFADASLFRDEIIDMAQNGFTLKQAYWAVAGPLVVGKKADAAATQAKQVEQNKKQAKHKQVTPGSTGNPGNSGKPVIPANIKAAADKLGMDPEEYMAWGNVSTLDQALALKGRK